MKETATADKKAEFLPYKVIRQPGNGEYEEKKSKFLASVIPVSSEEEVQAFFEATRKRYYDARHNCTAYIIGRNREITRCSDDGEPSGTAGKPMLEVLLGAQVTNAAMVVTRYFGGTLLGTGGLVRAYTQAAKMSVENAGVVTMRYGEQLKLITNYADVSKIQYFLEKEEVAVIASRYTEIVELDVRIPFEEKQSLQEALIQLTAARIGIETTGFGYYMDTKGYGHCSL